MQKQPEPAKGLHFILIFAFAMMPLLLFLFVVPQAARPTSPSGSGLLPILVSCLSGSVAIFFLMSKLNSDLKPEQFQTNMLMTLAFGELITLMGVFIGLPAGLPVIPFLIANYAVIALVVLKVMNYWMPRR